MTGQAGNARGTWRPKICENMPDLADRTLRWAAQLGLDALALGGHLADPERLGYWTEANCRAVAERVGEYGLEVGIMMLHNVTRRIILGLPGRDEDLEQVLRSIRAAAAAGYPVIEYNFYNHRGVEGYGQRPGRGGALYTDYDNAGLDAARARGRAPDMEKPGTGCATSCRPWCVATRWARLARTPAARPHQRGTAQVVHGFEGMS